MLGNCKYCEYGHQYDNWCELKNKGHNPLGVECEEYLKIDKVKGGVLNGK